MKELIECMIDTLASRDNSSPGDYMENGILMCGTCHSPKQATVDFNGGPRLVPTACLCREREEDERKRKARKADFDSRMSSMIEQYGISDRSYSFHTFAADDRREAAISQTCRRYVQQWEVMLSESIGILFYGTVGTGKSFYACAIVNALLEQMVTATVTNFPRLLNILQGAKDRQAYIDHLQCYKLLVIDDLGVERESSYAAEQVYNVIDTRSRSGLPLIVTTNLTMEELKAPPSMQAARIYDRILDMCPVAIRMTGASRRAGNAEARRAKARELLRGDNSADM